ncbi:MAG: hypothetical protein M1825_005191 [Sarcosagium campestre]|nr:MAG: hypothetical protein M1825_005191 [Sarcosagium campestre]
MLRAASKSARALEGRSIGPGSLAIRHSRRRRLQATIGQASRQYSDLKLPNANSKESIADPKPPILPGSASKTAAASSLKPASINSPGFKPASQSPVTPTSSPTIAAKDVPRTPPAPPAAPKTQSAVPPGSPPQSSSSGSASTPSPKKPRRFRRFVLSVFFLITIGYGGGIYYSMVNDNFHDFFTEYVPFGEEAVLYLEEREFRKRFPNALSRTAPAARDPGSRVTIPSKSGMSWKLADGDSKDATRAQNKPAATSKDSSNSKKNDGAQPSTVATRKETEKSAKTKKVEQVKKSTPDTPSKTPASAQQSSSKPEQKSSPKVDKPDQPQVASAHSEQKSGPPLSAIDPLNINDAEEPIVQDLVKIINNIVTVINADNAASKFSSVMDNAKAELASIGHKITDLKQKVGEDKIKSTREDFDRAAKELVRRLEEEVRDQESRWKEEFETEREKISHSYQERLKAELGRSEEVAAQRFRNELLEQAVKMRRDFIEEVKDRVESERDGRLSKLSELSGSVHELEKLTADWNAVVDANLKTQHLHVAVEAVRANLEQAEHPRPFVRELAALKEIASDDAVVNSAIASISPVAYQRGVPTSAQLIDRFRRVSAEVRKASLLPDNAGIASHAASWVLSNFLFRKQGLALGDDVESVLTRTGTLLQEGDLDGAAREMNGLDGWAKTLSKDWLGDLRRVLEVQQALDVIATEARLQSLRVEG